MMTMMMMFGASDEECKCDLPNKKLEMIFTGPDKDGKEKKFHAWVRNGFDF